MFDITALPLINAAQIAERVSMLDATRALQKALQEFDPADALQRRIEHVEHGQLLLMPAEVGRFAGQKFATVAPANTERGLDRIQAVYILLDAETLSPVALMDGTELTSIRTPAVSAAIIDLLAVPGARELVVFGTGPQGIRHVEAMLAIRPQLERVTLIGRNQGKAQAAADAASKYGVPVAVGTGEEIASADIIVTATTAAAPLFDDDAITGSPAIAAVGSHETDRRELPGALVARSQTVIESVEVALRECGDATMAIAEGLMSADGLVPMIDIVRGSAEPDFTRPRIIKTAGMGWQDLVVASLLAD
ncbi:MAG TPA: ornithine cyclodeaminase family protein [Candidatus Agrococcus pullicola]|uniref:Ornithine cyclodeaminase family protein n=1 Tax=Candidatus Agrococcus pullicola TaxID=2838429 RepID=A0A9D1YTI7_9MICO|nr:ornithine cyclodeaminase family protein [Candidatus Agrococcus pullicola]